MKSNTGSHYFYSVFATTLVLVVIGLVAGIAYEARLMQTRLSENLLVEVELTDDMDSTALAALQSLIAHKSYVHHLDFVSKTVAAESLKKELGEDYLSILGYNPLYPSFHINLKEDYANPAAYEKIQKELKANEGVVQVNIQRGILADLDKGIKSFTFMGLLIGVIFLAFAVSLIFSSIRMDIFGRRQTIKSMQLFGATRWFIIRPYMVRSIGNGLLSGILASACLFGLGYYLDLTFPALGLTSDLVIFAILTAMLILFGILISFGSTLIALSRYLNYKIDDLH
jgi:cell division transport system permease protein